MEFAGRERGALEGLAAVEVAADHAETGEHNFLVHT